MKHAYSPYLHLQLWGFCPHANEMNWVVCQVTPVQTWFFNRKPKLCLFWELALLCVTYSRPTTLREEAAEASQRPGSNGRLPNSCPHSIEKQQCDVESWLQLKSWACLAWRKCCFLAGDWFKSGMWPNLSQWDALHKVVSCLWKYWMRNQPLCRLLKMSRNT